MKSLTLMSLVAAAGIVSAGPTPTEKDLQRRTGTLPTVTPSGNAFYAGSDRFYLRGIDYQPGGSSGSDPLLDTTACKRDIAEFKKLGVNTIRVYMVDNSQKHDECMAALDAAGIYLVLDLNNPKYSINRAAPANSYNAPYLQSIFATVDAFKDYTNTLAFFSGNEVINEMANSTLAAPYVKATTRDIRQYIKTRGYRNIPVGYSAADVAANRMETAQYFNCGTDDERSDFFAFNDYSWCSPSSFEQSGWDQKVKNFTGYGLPIFLSEWGCYTNGRTFEELGALMNSEMTGVYSGGLLYEYSKEGDNFGIVQISGGDVTELKDYGTFQSALSQYPAPTGNGGAVATTNSVSCPTTGPSWMVKDDSLPTIPDDAKKYMTAGPGPGPGLKGAGSQDLGPGSTGTAAPGSGSATSSAKNDGGRPVPPMDKSILAVAGLVGFFTLAGTLIL